MTGGAMNLSVPRWWRQRSLRARLTMTTTAGLAIALLAAAMLLHVALRASLITGLDATARQGAQEVAALAEARRPLPHPVPVAPGTITIQVLNRDGRIVDVSPGADWLVPLLPPLRAAADARAGRAVLMDGRPLGLPNRIRVVSVPARGEQTVIAAVPFDQVDQSVAALTRDLLVGTPLLLLLLAGATWLVVGSALRPISALRRGAQKVTVTGRPSALPVPEARDEVRDLAVTLNDMLTRLETAQRRQRNLVSDTAHELRNPIASMRTQLEVALDYPERQDWALTAADVLADTLRLSRLAEDLLVLARLDEMGPRVPGVSPDGDGGPSAGGKAALTASRGGPGVFTRTPRILDLAPLAAEEAERCAGTSVRVTLTAAEPCAVAGDAEGLRRLIDNLIENAVRYARSRVDVAVTLDGDQARLTVTDDGPGIPAEEDRERVFGRFVRLDDARSRDDDGTSGAGLGLAIVRATAHAHGGSAWLEDASPGLRAVVCLPTTNTGPE
jgi:signal transduction histidine kinase